MMMKKLVIFTSYFFLIATVVSCVKKDDQSEITVKISHPYENSVYTNLDTIPVKVMITSKFDVEMVEIQLLNEAGNVSSEKMIIHPNAKSFQIDTVFVQSGFAIESGLYTLRVRANDGLTYGWDAVRININSLLEFSDHVLLVQSFPQSFDVFPMDNSQNIHLKIDGDYADAKVSAERNHLYVAGKELIDFKAFELYSEQSYPIWEGVGSIVKPYHPEDCMYIDSDHVFVTSTDGNVRSYNHQGLVDFDNEIQTSGVPQQVHATKNVVAIEAEEYGTGFHFLELYYRYTNGFMLSLKCDIDIVSMFTIDDDNFTVVGNSEDGIQIAKGGNMQYKLDNLHLIKDEYVINTASYDRYIAIGTFNKIFIYDREQNFVHSNTLNIQAEKMVIVPNTGDLYVLRDSDVFVYSFPDGELKYHSNFAGEIIDLLVY